MSRYDPSSLLPPSEVSIAQYFSVSEFAECAKEDPGLVESLHFKFYIFILKFV